MKNVTSLVVRVFAGALLYLLMASAQAGVQYSVSIDTQSLAGVSGYLDFGLVGLADSPAAAVDIKALGGGQANGPAQLDGDAAAIAGGWKIGNAGAFNAVLQGWNFGGTLSFLLDFSGDWLSASQGGGTTFAFKLWDSNFNNLLTSDAFGDLFRIELSSGGTTGVDVYATAHTEVSPAVQGVPEPAMIWLLALAAAIGLAARRRV